VPQTPAKPAMIHDHRTMFCSLFVFTLILLSSGCRTANESRLVGIYRANGSCVVITLVVNPDHSFIQSTQTRKGETNQLTGRWSVDKKDRMITFEPFLDFLNDDHGRRLGSASFPPEVFGSVIEMGPIIVKCPDSDHEIYYSK
jgi:hypothetical protein